MTSDVVVQPVRSTPPSAGSRSLRLVAIYLALTTIPILRHAVATSDARGATIASLHVTALAAIVALLASRTERDEIVAWIPLVLWPAMYAEVPGVIAGLGSSFHDVTVQAWDLAVFHGQPSRTLAGALPNSLLSEVLHAGYLSYYGLIYLPPALLFATGRRADFARTVFAVTAVWLACLVAFILFPVAGPRFLWGAPPNVPRGAIRSFVVSVLELGSARGTAFPSSHVAVAVAQSLMALRLQRPVGLIASTATVLLAFGAVYGGFHYAIDVVVGAALGVAMVALVDRPKHGAAQ